MNCVCPPTAIRTVVGSCLWEHALSNSRCSSTTTSKRSCDNGFIHILPTNQTTLYVCHSHLNHHHNDTHNQHPRIYTGRIEIALSLTDDPSKPLRRSKVFTDDRPNQSKSYRRMKTRQDPRHRRR